MFIFFTIRSISKILCLITTYTFIYFKIVIKILWFNINIKKYKVIIDNFDILTIKIKKYIITKLIINKILVKLK